MTTPQITFGCNLSVESYWNVAEFARRAEELGFDSVFYGDSLGSYQLECWTALAIIASYTKSIRLGPAVTFPLIRHPSILARTAATVDQFSDGRLEFRVGLGGRTMKSDSVKYGLNFRTHNFLQNIVFF